VRRSHHERCAGLPSESSPGGGPEPNLHGANADKLWYANYMSNVEPKIKTALPYVVFVSMVALVLASAWHIFAAAPEVKGLDGKVLSLADRATLLFGTATVALVLVTLLIGIIAIIEWQRLKRTFQQAIDEKLTNLDTRTEGRLSSLLGFALGDLSTEPDQLEATNRNRLAYAVSYCQAGYDLLKKAEEERKPTLQALNNLVYYSCIYGEPWKSKYLLQQARLLLEAGSEFGSLDFLLTYCRAILRYGEDRKEIDNAISVAESVLSSNKLTDNQKREARFYLAALTLKRDEKES